MMYNTATMLQCKLVLAQLTASGAGGMFLHKSVNFSHLHSECPGSFQQIQAHQVTLGFPPSEDVNG